MWIALLFILSTEGTAVTGASRFDSEEECRAALIRLSNVMQASKDVAAYRTECFDVKELTLKKPSAPSLPPPTTEKT